MEIHKPMIMYLEVLTMTNRVKKWHGRYVCASAGIKTFSWGLDSIMTGMRE